MLRVRKGISQLEVWGRRLLLPLLRSVVSHFAKASTPFCRMLGSAVDALIRISSQAANVYLTHVSPRCLRFSAVPAGCCGRSLVMVQCQAGSCGVLSTPSPRRLSTQSASCAPWPSSWVCPCSTLPRLSLPSPPSQSSASTSAVSAHTPFALASSVGPSSACRKILHCFVEIHGVQYLPSV